MKLQDMNMAAQIAGYEIARHEIAGHENARHLLFCTYCLHCYTVDT